MNRGFPSWSRSEESAEVEDAATDAAAEEKDETTAVAACRKVQWVKADDEDGNDSDGRSTIVKHHSLVRISEGRSNKPWFLTAIRLSRSPSFLFNPLVT